MAPPAAAGARLPAVVLDTNVCLDLFLYRDRGCAALMLALEEGRVTALTDPACREEWLRVLHYPQFGVGDAQRLRLVAEFDRWCQPLAVATRSAVPLPVCKDGDDQKFLELAQASGARWLLTKDKALLKLARRTRKAGLFLILTPQSWSALPDVAGSQGSAGDLAPG